MKSSAKNIVLKSVDDIFQTEENRADAQRERVQEIPLDQLKPFRNHPFKVRDDRWTASVNTVCWFPRLRDPIRKAAMS